MFNIIEQWTFRSFDGLFCDEWKIDRFILILAVNHPDFQKMESVKPGYINLNSKKIKEGFIGQRMIVLPPNIKKGVIKNAVLGAFCKTVIKRH